MGSSNTANNIVDDDIMELIEEANKIVRSCSGINCNFSTTTQTQISQSLSKTAQNRASGIIYDFSIPRNSVVARNIYDGYLNLGAAVSSTYSYQCGSTTANNVNCILNSDSVQTARNNLVLILTEPVTNNQDHIIILSIVLGISMIAFILFLIFLAIGLFEFVTITPDSYPKFINYQYIQDVTQSNKVIPISVSPTSNLSSSTINTIALAEMSPTINTVRISPTINTARIPPTINTVALAGISTPASPFDGVDAISE